MVAHCICRPVGMIGDTVNLAARIQELTKTFDSDILISGDTYLSVNNQFNTHYFGTVTVRGKKIETDIYGVMQKNPVSFHLYTLPYHRSAICVANLLPSESRVSVGGNPHGSGMTEQSHT